MSRAAVRGRVLVLAAAALCAAVPAWGQAPGAVGPPTAPAAPPDTLTAALVPFAGKPALVELRVEPAAVTFGGTVTITARAREALAPADTLALPSWLELDAAPRPIGADPSVPSATFALRVYGVQPFRVAVGDLVTGVVTVAGRGTDGTRIAPVRDPLRPGWNALFAAGLLVAAIVAALLARWLWRRRRGPRPRPVDLPARPVAWPRAAVALDEVIARWRRDGDARAFLDGVAAVARGYAADRFGIAGREMTGDEIAAACRSLGHPTAVGDAFARVLATVDARRYDPRPLDDAWCRARAAELLDAIAAVRVEPGPTPLPTDELAAGRAAWERLVAGLRTPGRETA